jgi:hypothetical protein
LSVGRAGRYPQSFVALNADARIRCCLRQPVGRSEFCEAGWGIWESQSLDA